MNLPEPPELLPCPFCGSKPNPPEKEDAPDWKGEYWKVSCDVCDFDFYHNGPHNVVRAWNNRPAEAEAIRAFVERAQARVAKFGERPDAVQFMEFYNAIHRELAALTAKKGA